MFLSGGIFIRLFVRNSTIMLDVRVILFRNRYLCYAFAVCHSWARSKYLTFLVELAVLAVIRHIIFISPIPILDYDEFYICNILVR